MYVIARCKDGLSFQVFIEDDEYYVVAHSDMSLRPYKFITHVDKLPDAYYSPGHVYKAGIEWSEYYVRYLDASGVRCMVKVDTLEFHPQLDEAQSLIMESGHHKVDKILRTPMNAVSFNDARALMGPVSWWNRAKNVYISFRDTSLVTVSFLEELAELICEKSSVETWYIHNTKLEVHQAGYSAKSVLDSYIKTHRPDSATFRVVWTDKIGKEKR